jgi:hypothetical protein
MIEFDPSVDSEQRFEEGFNLTGVAPGLRTPNDFFFVVAPDQNLYPVPREIVVGNRVVGLCSCGNLDVKPTAVRWALNPPILTYEVVNLDMGSEYPTLGLNTPQSVQTENVRSEKDNLTDENRLVGSHEAADMCGVTDRTITSWAKSGKLRVAGKSGIRFLFDVEDVRQMLESRQLKPNNGLNESS